MADADRPAEARGGFDRDQVDADRKRGKERAIGQQPARDEPFDRSPHVGPLPSVEGLLRQAEAAIASPADLHDDQGSGRTGIEREQIELPATDAHVTAQHLPADGDEKIGDGPFCFVTGPLLQRPPAGHPPTMA